MSLHRRLVPFAALSVSVDLMATKDTSGSGESGDGGPEQPTESADISARLQELARQLGINQAALARLLGISRQTFNPYFTGTRGAGLPTIRKAAQRGGPRWERAARDGEGYDSRRHRLCGHSHATHCVGRANHRPPSIFAEEPGDGATASRGWRSPANEAA